MVLYGSEGKEEKTKMKKKKQREQHIMAFRCHYLFIACSIFLVCAASRSKIEEAIGH
jgi:hypothetical protein